MKRYRIKVTNGSAAYWYEQGRTYPNQMQAFSVAGLVYYAHKRTFGDNHGINTEVIEVSNYPFKLGSLGTPLAEKGSIRTEETPDWTTYHVQLNNLSDEIEKRERAKRIAYERTKL